MASASTTLPRHYCDYCSVWTQGDARSIKHHENGSKHQSNVQRYLVAQRKKKADDARNAHELKKTLAQIEEAAAAAHANDTAVFSRVAPPPPPPPPPPPDNDPYASFSAVGHVIPSADVAYPAAAVAAFAPAERRTRWAPVAPIAPPVVPVAMLQPPPPPQVEWQYAPPAPPPLPVDEQPAAPPPPPPLPPTAPAPEEVEGGEYTVKGVTYCHGALHASKFVAGASVEAYIDDDWRAATVIAAHAVPVPNTSIIVRTYNVQLVASGLFRDAVPLDDVRMIAANEASAPPVEDAPVIPTDAAPPGVDEHTGLGVWQTVAIIDTEAEAAASAEAVAHAGMKRRRELQEGRDASAPPMLFDNVLDAGDSALSSFNPYGGKYKGVALDDAAEACGSDGVAAAASVNVEFKKRAVRGGNIRRRAAADDE